MRCLHGLLKMKKNKRAVLSCYKDMRSKSLSLIGEMQKSLRGNCLLRLLTRFLPSLVLAPGLRAIPPQRLVALCNLTVSFPCRG